MTIKTKAFALDIKTLEENGKFAGYGSVFGVVDSYGESVAPGAFADSLNKHQKSGTMPLLLWQHNPTQPIGIWTDLHEDGKGLYGEGQLLKDDVRLAGEAYALLKAKAVRGLSIGYYVKPGGAAPDKDKPGTIKLTALDLVEVSIVSFPANPRARVDEVKSALEIVRDKITAGDNPDLPDLEKILREAGFSKSQAKVVAAHGLPELIRREAGGEDPAVSDGIRSFLADLRKAAV